MSNSHSNRRGQSSNSKTWHKLIHLTLSLVSKDLRSQTVITRESFY